jgi:hypothetical protein
VAIAPRPSNCLQSGSVRTRATASARRPADDRPPFHHHRATKPEPGFDEATAPVLPAAVRGTPTGIRPTRPDLGGTPGEPERTDTCPCGALDRQRAYAGRGESDLLCRRFHAVVQDVPFSVKPAGLEKVPS